MSSLAVRQETYSASLQHFISNFQAEDDIKTAPDVCREKAIQEMQREPLYTLFVTISEEDRAIRKLKPISILISSDGGHVFVENEKLGIFGEGTTTREAIDDFVTHIKYFYHYYKSLDKENLMGEAIRLKSIYETILQENRV